MHHFTEKRDRSRAKERISEKGGEAEARGATRNENERERERMVEGGTEEISAR